jgi:hypothetical protein
MKQSKGEGVPQEFTAAAVAAASVDAIAPYKASHASGEPYRSLIRHNPWTRPPNPGDALEWGKGWCYDTTVARKHPRWCDVDLPSATKDMQRLRRDFYEWAIASSKTAFRPSSVVACARASRIRPRPSAR